MRKYTYLIVGGMRQSHPASSRAEEHRDSHSDERSDADTSELFNGLRRRTSSEDTEDIAGLVSFFNDLESTNLGN